jgi:hypothetical protein
MAPHESMTWIGADLTKACVRMARVLCVLVVAGLSLVLAPVAGASAASFTWTGEAAESVWSATKNWAGETAPADPESVALDFPRIPSCTGACYKSTNDVSGLDVESLTIDDGDEYEVEGNEITLGSGGLAAAPAGGTSGPAGDFIGLPIALDAPQVWSVAGRSGGALGENGVFVEGDVTGAGKALTTDISNRSVVYLANDTEVGTAAFDGANTGEAGVLNGFVGLLGGDVDSEDGGSVSLSHIFLVGSGAVGSLTTNDAELSVGNGHPTGGIRARSVSFDPASEVEFEITGSGAVADTDYSQLSSSGQVGLNGSSVGVVVAPVAGSCPELTVGRTYTFVSTTGGLLGVFGDAAEGAELPLRYAKGCAKQASKYLRTEYHESGGTQTVTATVKEPGELPLPIQHYNPYEAPNAEGATRGAIAGALRIAEADAAERKASEEAEARARVLAEASAGEVSLAGTSIVVQSSGLALVKLDCKGSESCTGNLTLSAQEKGKKKHTIVIGTAKFSVMTGKTATVKVKLDAAGRSLLSAARGRLTAHLAILVLAPVSEHTQTASVRLIGQKARVKAKKSGQ